MRQREIIEVTLNGGRGSGAVVESRIEVFQASGDHVTSVSTQPTEMAGVNQVPIAVDGAPIPIHDFLPGTPHSVPVFSLSPDRFGFYYERFKVGIEMAVNQAARNQRDPVLFVHHANVQLAAAAELAERKGLPLLTMPHGTCIGGYEEHGNIAAYEDRLPEGETWGQIRRGLNQAAAVIAISQFMKNTQINPHVDDPIKVHVISNPLPKDIEDTPLEGYPTGIIDQFVNDGK